MRDHYSSHCRTVSTIFLILWFCLNACSASERDPAHRFRTFREDGCVIAENSGGPRFATELFRYELPLKIQGDPSVPESLLPRPGDCAATDDGYYCVVDTRERRIAVFDDAGRYIRSIGRPGEGPGDFQSMRLQSVREGVISIFDSSLQRTTHYGTDGTLIGIYRLHAGGRVNGLEIRKEGGSIALSRKNSRRKNITYSRLVITSLSVEQDTLATIECGEIEYSADVYIGTREGRPHVLSGPLPFSAGQISRYLPGKGILVSEGNEPFLRWFDSNGRLAKEIRLGIAYRPVTDEMKKHYAESTTVTIATTEPEWIYPEHIGFWNDAWVDDTGYIWLQAVAEAELRSRTPGTVMHVVSPEGEYLGVTELPCRFECVSRGKLLGYVTEEETGERIPTVFRIEPLVGGLKYPTG